MSPAVWVVKLNAIQVLALACFGVVLGVWLKRRVPILDRLSIPASIAGGLVYALVTLALRDRWANFEMDLVLRDILMIAFFTTIGMSASMRLVRVGGPQVLWFFLLASVSAGLQNVLGVGMARLFGLDPLIGLLAGSVTQMGGPATALAFGATFEKLGVPAASTVGLAAATWGIVAGGLLGGWIGARLIARHGLKSPAHGGNSASGAGSIAYAGEARLEAPGPLESESESEHSRLFRSVLAVSIAMGLGSLISAGFERLGLILPAYVGAMLAAAAIRNLDDRLGFAGISQHTVDAIGRVSLSVFIVMALLTLRLWELANLALPMIAMLVAQIVLAGILCVAACFRFMGRDYEAAVMSGGFCGFMLGTTANGVACMEELVRKFGPAPRAFIVVPLVGAFLIDFTNALIITTFTNLFR